MTVWRPALSLELKASVRVKLLVSIHFHGLGTWWCQGSCFVGVILSSFITVVSCGSVYFCILG